MSPVAPRYLRVDWCLIWMNLHRLNFYERCFLFIPVSKVQLECASNRTYNYEYSLKLLRDHVFRFLLNLLIIPLHNTCSEILNLLLLSFKQHAMVFVLGTRCSLCWLCYCFCIFISLCRLHWLWLLGWLGLDKNRFYFYTIPLPF